MLNVIVTSNWIMGELAAVMAPYDVTPAQYNVLRILRGSPSAAMTCSAIGERLLDRTPDVTRLLNRLERSGLIHRARSEQDRRVVEVAITPEGRRLLERMQAAVDCFTQRLASHLSAEEHRQLSILLEQLRTEQEAAVPQG